MTITVHSYTIYHSPNAYLGTLLLRRVIADLPDVQLVRRPIYVPRERGLMIAEMLVARKPGSLAPIFVKTAGAGLGASRSRSSIPIRKSSTSASSAGRSWPTTAWSCRLARSTRADAEKRDPLDQALF
jgi:hypothetical protein